MILPLGGKLYPDVTGFFVQREKLDSVPQSQKQEVVSTMKIQARAQRFTAVGDLLAGHLIPFLCRPPKHTTATRIELP